MNKRILELARQVWPDPNTSHVNHEKFAELIVRECAQVCRDQPNVYALKADRDNCAIAIEQHFGVE